MTRKLYKTPLLKVVSFSCRELMLNPGSDLTDGGDASGSGNPPMDTREATHPRPIWSDYAEQTKSGGLWE